MALKQSGTFSAFLAALRLLCLPAAARKGRVTGGQIFVNGLLWFTTAQVYPVLTRGAPREADLVLQRVLEPKADAAIPPAFIGDWLVEDISERGVLDNRRSPPPTLAFAADGQVYGGGGCNRFTGAATFAGESLTIGPLAATMMACIPAVADQERRYFAALSKVRSARIEGTALILSAADGATLARLTRISR